MLGCLVSNCKYVYDSQSLAALPPELTVSIHIRITDN